MAFNTLFEDITDLRTVVPQVQSAAEAADLFPYFEEAVEKYIYPYLGEDFYQELKTAINDASFVITDMTADEQAIIYNLRRAEAYYGMYEALPGMLSSMSSNGMHEQSLEGGSAPRQWIVNLSLKSSIQKADLFMDKVLAVLEANPDSYTTWSESSEFTVYHELLLSHADKFAKINGSRRTFVALKPYIEMAQDRYIETSVGGGLIAALITKKKAATAFSAGETKVVEDLYKSISYYALYLGGEELRLDISNDGIRMVSTNDGITGLSPANANAYSLWLKKMEGYGVHYLARAKKYLDDNYEDFDDYSTEAKNKNAPNYAASNAVTGTTGSVMI